MPQPRLAVAVSGGRDSTALLHCALHQAKALGIEVWALHVHHGLMSQASTWLQQVKRQSHRWGAHFDSRHLTGAPARGESVEAWARAGRYQALAEMAQAHGCSVVMLAHHRRDQAETWLLQALRGAGDAGLSAMPKSALRQGVHWVRPWLNTDAKTIQAYVRRHRLKYLEDPSNADLRFARNRLRHAVWPALLANFEDAEISLAAASQRAQESLALAKEAAQADLSVLVDDSALLCPGWLDLPPARRRNALRAWLTEHCASAPPQTLLDRLITELPKAHAGSWPAPGGVLRLHRGLLAMVTAERVQLAGSESAQRLDLSRPGVYALPGWGGHFEVRRALAGGAKPASLIGLVPSARRGGERFRMRPGAPSRSLKKQFQASEMAAWQRQGPLLVSSQGELVFVPGLGFDAAFQAPAGADQLQLKWAPGAAG